MTTSKRCSDSIAVAFLDMCIRIEVSCHGNGLAVYVEAVGIMQVGQVVEEIAHAAAHVKYHFRGGGRKHIRHVGILHAG